MTRIWRLCLPDGDGGCSFIKRKAEETPSHNRRASVGSWGLALASPDNMSAIACIGVPVATRALAARRTAGTAASARSTTVVVATRGAGASPPSARLCGKTSAVVAKRSLRGTSAPFVSHAARGDATRTSAAALEVAAPVDGEEDAKKQVRAPISSLKNIFSCSFVRSIFRRRQTTASKD